MRVPPLLLAAAVRVVPPLQPEGCPPSLARAVARAAAARANATPLACPQDDRGERRKVGARVVGLDDRRLKKARLANKRLVLGELRKLLEAQRASLGQRWRDLQSIAGNRGLDRVWGTISGTSSGASRGLC